MAILSVDEVRALGAGTLTDDALTLILEANQAEIDRLYPVGVPITKTYILPRDESVILLPRPPVLSTSPLMPEIREFYGTSSQVTLADDDFYVEGATLRRVDGGTNVGSFFSSPVRVTWVYPEDPIREIVLAKLCQLDMTGAPNRKAFTVGKHREEFALGPGTDYKTQRSEILALLEPPVYFE